MNVNLHIEELVLDGINLSPRQRSQLSAALQAELTRLIATEGMSPSLQLGGWRDRLSASNLQLSPDQSPTAMGHHIAQSIYGGLK
ncbi:MAG: hypothetical protein AAFO87_08470 [Cyanobacteria bacterium J06607_6]